MRPYPNNHQIVRYVDSHRANLCAESSIVRKALYSALIESIGTMSKEKNRPRGRPRYIFRDGEIEVVDGIYKPLMKDTKHPSKGNVLIVRDNKNKKDKQDHD